MNCADKIIGANGQRRERDFYATPPECTDALLRFMREQCLIKPGDTIWEPACGDGAITNVAQQSGYRVIGTDIQTGTDFLTAPTPECDWIITNPPFSLAESFIRRADKSGKPFAMLLKSQFWHAGRRLKLFYSNPPLYVLPLAWRADFTGQGRSLIDCVWCVWAGRPLFTAYYPLERPGKGAAYGEAET